MGHLFNIICAQSSQTFWYHTRSNTALFYGVAILFNLWMQCQAVARRRTTDVPENPCEVPCNVRMILDFLQYI